MVVAMMLYATVSKFAVLFLTLSSLALSHKEASIYESRLVSASISG